MKTKEKAVYGVIPYFGGEWTVEMRKEGNTTSRITGYGEFPFDRYPDIPVIDFRNNDKVMNYLRWSNKYGVEECENWSNKIYLPLKKYLAEVEKMGIKVIKEAEK